MTETFKDPWVLLGVKRDASDAEIKRAYRALAKQYHPDRNPGDEAAKDRFADVSRAYDQIQNSELREQAAIRFAGSRPNDSFSGLGEEFAAAFGDILQPEPEAPQQPQHADIFITFKESFTGATKQLALSGDIACAECGGSGAAAGHRPRRCDTCHGAGTFTAGRLRTECASCNGRGFTVAHPCAVCAGVGQVHQTRTVTVTIPPGTSDGTVVHVQEPAGSLAPDVLVHVEVEPSPVFKRTSNQADLEIDVPISYAEAALGAQIKIPAPDKTMLLRIPPGTSSGKVLRIPNRGMPKLDEPGERGYLCCCITVVVPKKLSNQQYKLITQLSHYDDDTIRVGLFSTQSRSSKRA